MSQYLLIRLGHGWILGLAGEHVKWARIGGAAVYNRRVAPGVYFWRLESESTTLTRKAIKID